MAAVVIASLVLLVVAGFVGYAVARLVLARRRDDHESARLAAFARTGPEAKPVVEASTAGMSPLSSGLPPGPPGAAASVDASRSESVISSGPPLGLRAVSEEPVFLQRAKDGQVTVQVGAKPSMPLTYILDPKTRAVLQAVAKRVDDAYAGSWAVLAEEDAEGRLRLTRLV